MDKVDKVLPLWQLSCPRKDASTILQRGDKEECGKGLPFFFSVLLGKSRAERHQSAKRK